MALTHSYSGLSVSGGLSLSPSASSLLQTQFQKRRWCYIEKVLRGATILHDDWDKEAGWTDADAAVYKDVASGQGPSVADILRYQLPKGVACADLKRYPFIAAKKDDAGLQGLLRAILVRKRPELQQQVFGWAPPRTRQLSAQQRFEAQKATYWEHATHENRMEMWTLQDTADFHANALLRIIYLLGETPPALRRAEATWRAGLDFARDVNFSKTIEAAILERLLTFKYWIDDPFAIDDPARPHDGEKIKAERDRLRNIDRGTGGRLLLDDKKNPVAGMTPEYPRGDDDLTAEMTYWSENHQFLFATAEYLAGQWMPDAVFRAGNQYRSEGSERTRPGDMTGRERMEHARPRLLRWLNDRLRFGFSEWNAPGYYEEDLQPLFNIADFCLDEQIRTRAHMVIDLVNFDLARLSLQGCFGLTAGRDYFEQKNTGLGQSVGDFLEVAFGTRDGLVVGGNSPAAVSLATSTRYVIPDVLIEIATSPEPKVVDRSRVSITFEDASRYGIGVDSDDDVMRWWSRFAYVPKQVIHSSSRLARKAFLMKTAPFKDILPALEKGGIAFGALGGLAGFASPFAIPGVSTILKPLLGSGDGESELADFVSILTEGSVLSRANLYAFRDRSSMLSSVQNWRAGQFCFQSQAVMATLGLNAMVWTGHPSAGAYISKQALEEAGEIGGGILGGLTGGALFGPAGLIVGGVLGFKAGKSAADSIAGDDPRGVKIWAWDTHDGPNWWTGTVTSPRVVQREGAAIAIYQPNAFQKVLFGKRTHAWFPRAAFDRGTVVQHAASSNVPGDRWTFGRSGDGYLGLYSAIAPEWTTDGPWKDKEMRMEAEGNVFIYQVGSADQYGSFEEFVRRVSSARIHVSGLDECSYDVPFGQRLELHYDDGPRWAGRAFSDDRFPRFASPYVSAGFVDFDQYHYTIAHRGKTLTHDFRQLKTVEKDPQVFRDVQGKVRTQNDHFLVIAHHGSPKTSCENTLQSLHQATEVEPANALEIDLCMTADGQVVLWHDWDPDDVVALLRQAGQQPDNRFRPRIPNVLSSFRRPINELTLAEVREHFGYQEIEGRSYAGELNPVDLRIPTLAEFMQASAGWDRLEHVFLDVKMPDSAAGDAPKMLDVIAAALALPHTFEVTALVPHEKVLVGMKNQAAARGLALPFSWDRELPAGVVLHADHFSAIDGAIAYGNTVASVGRPTSATFRPWHVYTKVIEYDTDRWARFNLDPKANRGRQIDKLIAWTTSDQDEIDWLLQQGVSGVITDDVPLLHAAARFNQLPL